MNESRDFLSAEDLRRAFDASFATAAAPRRDDLEPFLRVRIGDRPLAFRIRELAGVAGARKIVPIATTVPSMLGLIGVRAEIVPVFSAAALLDVQETQASPRWFALAAGDEPFALAFTDLEGFLEVSRADVRAAARQQRHVTEALQTGGELRGVIDVRSLLDAIRERVGTQRSTER